MEGVAEQDACLGGDLLAGLAQATDAAGARESAPAAAAPEGAAAAGRAHPLGAANGAAQAGCAGPAGGPAPRGHPANPALLDLDADRGPRPRQDREDLRRVARAHWGPCPGVTGGARRSRRVASRAPPHDLFRSFCAQREGSAAEKTRAAWVLIA